MILYTVILVHFKAWKLWSPSTFIMWKRALCTSKLFLLNFVQKIKNKRIYWHNFHFWVNHLFPHQSKKLKKLSRSFFKNKCPAEALLLTNCSAGLICGLWSLDLAWQTGIVTNTNTFPDILVSQCIISCQFISWPMALNLRAFYFTSN